MGLYTCEECYQEHAECRCAERQEIESLFEKLEAAEFEIGCLKSSLEQAHRRYDESSKGKDWRRRELLEAVVEAARSVLSEDGVDEFLCAYNMGCELILRVRALDREGT